MKKYQIAVIWSAWQEEYPENAYNFQELYSLSYRVWYELAKKNCYVLTWWKSWIMKWASQWCKDGEGISVWFIRGEKRWESNSFVDIEIVTNMWDGWDAFLIPYSADGAIVIWWWSGTLKEICGFYLQWKPVVLLDNTWWWSTKLKNQYLDERKRLSMMSCDTPLWAVDTLLSALCKKNA